MKASPKASTYKHMHVHLQTHVHTHTQKWMMSEKKDHRKLRPQTCKGTEGLTHHFLDLRRGAGFRGMRKRALMGCMSQRAAGDRKQRPDPVRGHPHYHPACTQSMHVSIRLLGARGQDLKASNWQTIKESMSN